jgi:uncharacterized membrane protein YozB (DUF420 family)
LFFRRPVAFSFHELFIVFPAQAIKLIDIEQSSCLLVQKLLTPFQIVVSLTNMPSISPLEFTKKNLLLLKIFGFSSITIIDRKSVTKFTDFLFFVFPLSLGFFCLYLTVVSREKLESSQSSIANYGNFILMIASICVSITSMILAFIFRHQIWLLLVRLVEVDENVGESNNRTCSKYNSSSLHSR